MPKLVLDKREKEIWLYGKANAPSPNEEKHNNLPAFLHLLTEKDEKLSQFEQWRDEVATIVHALAGAFGGYGIDFVDEEGNDLSDPHDAEKWFSYMRPTVSYQPTCSTRHISIDDLKSS